MQFVLLVELWEVHIYMCVRDGYDDESGVVGGGVRWCWDTSYACVAVYVCAVCVRGWCVLHSDLSIRSAGHTTVQHTDSDGSHRTNADIS